MIHVEVKQNVLSYTVSILRRIMKLMKKNYVSDLTSDEVKSNLNYYLIPEGEKWRLSILQEVLQVRASMNNVEWFEKQEIEEFYLGFIQLDCFHNLYMELFIFNIS